MTYLANRAPVLRWPRWAVPCHVEVERYGLPIIDTSYPEIDDAADALETVIATMRADYVPRPDSVTLHRQCRPVGQAARPSSQNILAEILAETAAVDRATIRGHDGVELTRRGYCRHCVGTLTA